MLTAEFPGRKPGFSLAEDTDNLFVGKTLLDRDGLMSLMKTLLTVGCIKQRQADQPGTINDRTETGELALTHFEAVH